MDKQPLILNKLKEITVNTSRRASFFIELSSCDMDNKKLGDLTAKACSIADRWLIIYEEKAKEKE